MGVLQKQSDHNRYHEIGHVPTVLEFEISFTSQIRNLLK